MIAVLCVGGDASGIKIYTLKNKINNLFDKDKFELVKCPSCDQVYLNPWVEGSEFDDSLPVTAKVLDAAIEEGLITRDYKPAKDKLKSAYPEILLLANKHYTKEKVVVDLGCGAGLSSLALKCEGFNVLGIEANEYLAESAKKLKIDTINTQFSNYKGEKFEQITFNSVIEHVHNPIQLMEDIRNNILHKNGKIIVTCPNIEGTQTVSEGAEFGNFHWGHVWYFSEKTLEAMMKKAGFSLIEFYRPTFKLSGIDENVRVYVKNLLGMDINIYGGVAGVFTAN